MGKTTIEWTDRSINPIRARDKRTGAVGHYCVKIAPECAHCYASAWQPRFRMPQFQEQVKLIKNGDIEIFLDESKLEEVLRRREPTKWFWCDMTDMFGDWLPDEMIDRCFAVMALTPHHTHQVLTKRPERMRAYIQRLAMLSGSYSGPRGPSRYGVYRIAEARDSNFRGGKFAGILNHIAMKTDIASQPPGWPLPNVWLIVSAGTQDTLDRFAPILLDTPAAVRGLSAEPLLEMIDPTRIGGDQFGWGRIDALNGLRYVRVNAAESGCEWETVKINRLDWVIIGGESGHKARPMHPDWARALRDQCNAAGVPFFFKQWGEWLPGDVPAWPENADFAVEAGKGHYFDDHQWMDRVGKKAAGRELDGRTWDEFPK